MKKIGLSTAFFAYAEDSFVFHSILQLVVQAYDNGNPPLYDTEVVTIVVDRNTEPPVFNPQNYPVTILETQSLGTTIVTVTATDPDDLFVSILGIMID